MSAPRKRIYAVLKLHGVITINTGKPICMECGTMYPCRTNLIARGLLEWESESRTFIEATKSG